MENSWSAPYLKVISLPIVYLYGEGKLESLSNWETGSYKVPATGGSQKNPDNGLTVMDPSESSQRNNKLMVNEISKLVLLWI